MCSSETYTDGQVESVEVEHHHVDIPIPEEPSAPMGRPGGMRFRNIDMDRMLTSLSGLLDRVDLIGYAAARNTRILRSEAQEYLNIRDSLIAELGEPQLDEDGNETGLLGIAMGTPAFEEFKQRIAQWAAIEHEPPIYRIPADEVIGKLSGSEILGIEWMLDWDA